MLSISWRRWIIARFGKKSSRQRSERRQTPLSLEWLERRDLLSTAAPLVVNQSQPTAAPQGTPGASGYTPSQISHAYGFDKIAFDNGTVKGDGTGQTIAIVTAYDNPNIINDLNAFNQQYKLPTAALTILSQTGGTVLPGTDVSGDWEAETAMDVEWAHALAPGANLLLVEAGSDNISDLLVAARTAASYQGVSVVSMSWGNAEMANETSYDGYFITPAGHTGVTFVASSGDSGAPPIYPAVSPNVLAVGGTTLTLDSAGDYISETAWSGSGGGISAYEPQPSYQHGVVTQSSTQRTSPDVAFDADSATGLAIYSSYLASADSSPWTVMAGTSAGAPAWAALIAIADQGRALNGEAPLDGSSQTLPAIYQMPSSNFHDIVTGSSTGTPPYSAGPGYDLVTGRGSPYADQVVYYLVGPSASPLNGQSPPSSPSGSPAEPSGPNLVQDGSFETPSVGANQLLNPAGSPWLFLGTSGIAGNGSSLTSGNAPAPDGLQVAFLYNQGSSILQSLTLAAGSYRLNFQAAQLGTMANSLEQIEVLMGGSIVATVTPGTSYSTYVDTFTIPSAGNYTLQFQGMAAGSGNAAVLDDVMVQSIGPGGSSHPPPASPPPSAPVSPSPDPIPSPSPSPSPAPASSSPLSGGQAPAAADQSPQDSLNALIQALLTSWYELLLDEMLLFQAELNQIMQISAPTAIGPNSGVTGLLAQQWLNQLLSQDTTQN